MTRAAFVGRIGSLALGALVALASIPLGGTVTVARAEPQPSALPGQPGGDPGPDTKDATDFLKRGRFEDAIGSARKALQRDERFVPAMLVMAKAYYGLKKYELATAIIDLARQLDPGNAECWNVLGFIALARNDSGTATANFKKATELKPDYGNAWNNLCAQLLLAKSYDAALEAGQKATELMPGFDKAWLNYGAAQRGKGMYTEAEASFRKALEINPNYADAWFNLGILYLDAPQMPNTDLIAKLNTAINHLAKYKNLASFRVTKDDPSDLYVDEARKAIDREQKRLERLRKQKEREAAKKPAEQPAAPTPAPPAPGEQPSGEQPKPSAPAGTEAAPSGEQPKPSAPPPAPEPAPAPAPGGDEPGGPRPSGGNP